MQDLETDINRIFLDGYGLGSELQPEVPVEQITLLCNPANRYRKKTRTRKSTETESGEAESAGTPEERASYPPEQLSALFQADAVREFLSYAVGCMMGRFSLDRPGLILADAGDSIREYLAKVRQPHDKLRFAPDEDGIIPVLDAERFADDIVLRTCAFLNATFGPETREENVKFIEAALGKDLRKYFLTDFYRYHLQAYKKRPIYWMFTSGRQRSFQCLVYLHRYNDGTLARMRTEYVIPLQGQIAACIDEVEAEKLKATSTSRRRAVQKEQDTLRKQQAELLVFDEKLKHAADQKIALDLDDGVKVNYEKFGDLLAEVDTVTGGSDE
jgi:type II restriction/modification system DNA methylase subunit YeeA